MSRLREGVYKPMKTLEFVLSERRQQLKKRFNNKRNNFAVACYNIAQPINIGSIIRTAHCFAAKEFLVIGGEDSLLHGAQGAYLWENIKSFEDVGEFTAYITKMGYSLVSIELTSDAVDMREAKYPPNPCFLVGKESTGVPRALLDKSELVVEIPMFGLLPCLNVGVATGITIYDYISKEGL